MFKKISICLFTFCLLSLYSFAQDWQRANANKQLPDSTGILALATNGNTVFAATTKGLYISTNNGTHWDLKNTGLSGKRIYAFAFKGTDVIIGTSTGIFVSSDIGDNWIPKNVGMSGETVYALLVDGNNVFAGVDGGVYISTDNCSNWSEKNEGFSDAAFMSVSAFAKKGNLIFTGTSDGVYITSDNGSNWVPKSNGLVDMAVTYLVASNNAVYLSCDSYLKGVYQSVDNGENWVQKNNGLLPESDQRYSLICADDTTLLAGGMVSGVYISTNRGNSWESFNNGLSDYIKQNELILAKNDTLYYVASKGETGFCNLWKKAIREDSVVQAVNDVNSGAFLKINPNPTTDVATISYQLQSAGNINLTVIDVLGRETVNLVSGYKEAGEYKHTFSKSETKLNRGIYFIKLTIAKNVYMTKMIIE
ncbi:MAG: T9SS type A sorting domain-containing protein [Bacteroidota bacterium]|jgi:photosystem II stability/assembly factor-like uncharacterized protein